METEITIKMYDSAYYNSWDDAIKVNQVFRSTIAINNLAPDEVTKIIASAIGVTCTCLGCSTLLARVKTTTTQDILLPF